MYTTVGTRLHLVTVYIIARPVRFDVHRISCQDMLISTLPLLGNRQTGHTSETLSQSAHRQRWRHGITSTDASFPPHHLQAPSPTVAVVLRPPRRLDWKKHPGAPALGFWLEAALSSSLSPEPSLVRLVLCATTCISLLFRLLATDWLCRAADCHDWTSRATCLICSFSSLLFLFMASASSSFSLSFFPTARSRFARKEIIRRWFTSFICLPICSACGKKRHNVRVCYQQRSVDSNTIRDFNGQRPSYFEQLEASDTSVTCKLDLNIEGQAYNLQENQCIMMLYLQLQGLPETTTAYLDNSTISTWNGKASVSMMEWPLYYFLINKSYLVYFILTVP